MKLKLKTGEKILVKIEEISFDGSLIIDFAGSLFRVVNRSRKTLKAGDRVFLCVVAESPLEFQIVERGAERSTLRFEREI